MCSAGTALNRGPEPADPIYMSGEASQSLRKAVEAELDRLRPALIADGGNVELVGVDAAGTVRLALQGECATCPAQLATIRIGLERPLRNAVPGVTSVVPV